MKHIGQFKRFCVACGSRTNPKDKEHPFPKWLIKLTKTDKTSIRWLGGNKISATGATLPLCQKCNSAFGDQLEVPMSRILRDIESGLGLSDNEAELIVRWLWKIDGLLWHVAHPAQAYSKSLTLSQRVLNPINELRGHLVLALGLCEEVETCYGDAPMGLDCENEVNAIFVSGVFSRTAMIVSLDIFAHLIPAAFSIYHLHKMRNDLIGDAKLFFPKIACRTDTELVMGTKYCSGPLQAAHEYSAKSNQQMW